MKKLAYVGKYPLNMDKPCISLCDALNSLPTVKTFESCCGHNKDPEFNPFVIWFRASDWRTIAFLGRCLDCRYWKYGRNWRLVVDNGDTPNCENIVFRLECFEHRGRKAYNQAVSLVKNMNSHINHINYVKAFLKTIDGFILREE